MTRAIATAVAAIVAFGALASTARANVPDTFGFGPRAVGLAGAVTADARGPAAAWHNPAGVALGDDAAVLASYSYGAMGLRLDGGDAGVTAPRGVSLGVAVPWTLGPVTIAFGLALYLPDQYVARIELVPATEPHFALLDQNLQHIVVTPVVSLRLGSHLALGAGATVLADAAGNGIRFDVGVSSGDKVGQGALDVSLPIRAAPVVGLLVTPRRWLRVGLAYRGEIDLHLALDILAHVDLPGALTGDTLISLAAVSFYTPHTITAGVALDLGPLTLDATLDWAKWSDFSRALPDLRVNVGLAIAPSLTPPMLPVARFDDQWTARVAAELRRELRARVTLQARLGYAFVRSPVPPQTGLTSFADGDRHVIALGAGVVLRELWRLLPKPLAIDVALQVHELEPRATVKDARLTSSPGFSSSGTIVYLTAGVEARF